MCEGTASSKMPARAARRTNPPYLYPSALQGKGFIGGGGWLSVVSAATLPCGRALKEGSNSAVTEPRPLRERFPLISLLNRDCDCVRFCPGDRQRYRHRIAARRCIWNLKIHLVKSYKSRRQARE